MSERLTKEASERRRDDNRDDVGEAVRVIANRAAIINGLLGLVGILVSAYVYLHFSLPIEIQRNYLDKFGRPLDPESTILYLSAFPVFQIWLFAMPALSAWWPSLRRRAIDRQVKLQTQFPRIRAADESVVLYTYLFIALVAVQMLFLAAAIYRSVYVATNVA